MRRIPVIWLRGSAALKRPFMGSLVRGQIGWGADIYALTPRYRLWPDAGYRNAAYLSGAVTLPDFELRS
ncbi:MAG: hypothetical protein P4L50_07670 [Anaerolineaceae bacterium]|nr:hypothetical protein [Anaerolineaceae bacterium]